MEDLVTAYRGKRVLLTGHTGFKGGWLALWLRELGANVTGFALPPDTSPSLFEAAHVGDAVQHVEGDLRELEAVRRALRACEPDYVFHLAAQPLVRRSYQEPLLTIETNVLGTAHVLEALRLEKRPCSAVIVTSDKCYENRETEHAYREEDPLGGHDVYSMSKGCAELVTASYRRSFLDDLGIAVASARAGNVIGGGDWCADRLVPDAVKALADRRPIPVRNPKSVRPWQHVLEPLSGYLALGARIENEPPLRTAFNFGPDSADSVQTVIELLIDRWGEGMWENRHDPRAPHEAALLMLSTGRAHARLGWRPRWSLQEAVRRTADWYKGYYRDRRTTCLEQIRDYAAVA
ncbi:MAG: CDP-glucose 4,6-dehydratase [Myxococcales bacterium]|nr:CDP-glucose 4,6-dehydratase [Myxococcales bacterium]